MKLCSNCKRPVDYSVCTLISTNRLSPRLQRCSVSVPFCGDCLNTFLRSGDEKVDLQLRQTMRPAFEHLIAQMKRIYGY
jgi:hypothetical protein